MTVWTNTDLKSKEECFKADQTREVQSYILDSSERTDHEGKDISRDDIDLNDPSTWDVVWSIIDTRTGNYFVEGLEVNDMVNLLNFLNFSKEI